MTPPHQPLSRPVAAFAMLVTVVTVLTVLVGAACVDASTGPEGVRVTLLEPTAVATTAPGGPAATSTANPAACTETASDLMLRVVDKEHALPDEYVPDDLTPVPVEWLAPGQDGSIEMRVAARDALLEMLAAARDDGHELRVRSAFRSFEEQTWTFQYWVDLLGEAQAERESARPGHSEHQLGTTADLTSAAVDWELVPAFGETPEGRWVERHAAGYGFALSYPRGAEAITGYVYEPWHLRFIGRRCAAEWSKSGMTLVEFLAALRDESATR